MKKSEFSKFLHQGLVPRHLVISYRELEYFINQKLEKYNLHRVEALYLLLLNFDEGKNQKEISEEMKTDNTLTSKILKKLRSKNLIEKRQDQIDGREKNIFLTQNAKDMIPEILEVYEEIGTTALNGVNLTDYMTTLDTLNKIIDNLHEENSKVRS